MRDLCQSGGRRGARRRSVVRRRARGRPTRTSASRRRTDASRRSPTSRARASASACLVDGAWGFACDRRLDRGRRPRRGAPRVRLRARRGRSARRDALAPARAARAARTARRSSATRSRSRSPRRSRSACAPRRRCATPDVKVRQALVRAQREHKLLRHLRRHRGRAGAGRVRRRHRRARGPRRRLPDAQLPERARRLERQAGWEYVEGLAARARGAARRRAGGRAAARRRVPAGRDDRRASTRDQVALQVHESVGHPTELDRVYGTEAAYAGTSFLKPDDLGSLRYGSELMNITADSTTPGGLGTLRASTTRACPRAREPIVVERRAHAASSPRARRRRGSAPAPAARCARTAGTGCRSSA